MAAVDGRSGAEAVDAYTELVPRDPSDTRALPGGRPRPPGTARAGGGADRPVQLSGTHT
ncbi:hypothetical protein GCM10009730_40380 [Streptomyces albidochromogenes]